MTQLNKYHVCVDCLCTKTRHLNCRRSYDSNYSTVELECEECSCCGSVSNEPADTDFNKKVMKDYLQKKERRMKDGLVTYETAKLANKKKAYLPSDTIYLRNKRLTTRNSYMGKGWCIAAPTQSSLQKWLRETHNIDVEPHLVQLIRSNGEEVPQTTKHNKYYSYKVLEEGVLYTWNTSDEEYTYEEALEEGLRVGLEMIGREKEVGFRVISKEELDKNRIKGYKPVI